MNGLSEEFAGRMVFERRNANEAAGQGSLDAYGLRGHPTFVIAAPDGAALWSQMGASAAEPLHAAVQEFAAGPAGE